MMTGRMATNDASVESERPEAGRFSPSVEVAVRPVRGPEDTSRDLGVANVEPHGDGLYEDGLHEDGLHEHGPNPRRPDALEPGPDQGGPNGDGPNGGGPAAPEALTRPDGEVLALAAVGAL